ncbi:MAG: phage tail tape measure protein [Aristaeellaceae bacterium]
MAAKEYTMAFSIGAKLSGQFNAAFKGAGSTIQSLQGQIQSLQKAQGNISAYQKQQSAIEKTRSKLELLQKQYANLQAEMNESDNASAALKNQMLSKQHQIDRTSASLDEETKRLDAMGNVLKHAGIDTKNLATESESLASKISALKQQQDAEAAAMQEAANAMQEAADTADDMGNSMTNAASGMEQMLASAGVFEVLKKGAEILSYCANASIEFESVMTGVDKTTDLTKSELAQMSSAVKQLSTDIPATTTELGEVGEVAGQLGIAKRDLLDFTTVMTMLSTATTMSSSEAATMSAQFANITRMDPSKYSNLGSTIVDLGNNYATTEQKILDMGQGIAAAGNLAGMSEADMMGLSAAVTSLGIETQAGATSMNTLITRINKAVETGEGLTDYASVANMSGAEFTRAWGTDAAGALVQFIKGLADTERNGKSAVVILDELGISEARLQRMMLSLSTSGDLMTRAISTANTAWKENTALTAEAEKRYATTESKLKMASNAANNLKIAVGDALTPSMRTFADVSKDALIGVTSFVEKNPALVQGMVTAGGVIGGVTLAVTGYSAAAKVAAAASALLTSSIPGVKTLMLVTAGVSALAGVVVGLSGSMDDASDDFATLDADFDSLNEQLEEQERISDLIDEYKSLSKELSSVSDAAGGIKGGEASIQITPEATGTLGMADFVPGYDDDTWIVLIKGQKDRNAQQIDPQDFVGTSPVQIKGEAIQSVLAQNLLQGDDYVLVHGKKDDKAELLTVDQFVEKNREILLTADKDPESELLDAANFLADTTVTILGKPDTDADKLVQAIDLVAPGAATITAEPDKAKLVEAVEFLLPDSTVPLSAQVSNTLTSANFVPDTSVKLTAEAAQYLAASKLLDGTTVTLSGHALAELRAEGFLKDEDTTVTLTPEMADHLEDAECFADGDLAVSLTPTLIDTLKAQECVDVTKLSFSAEVTNLADLQSQITDLQNSASAAKTELDTASATLETMKERYIHLENRMTAAKKPGDKSALQQEMDELDAAITAQEDHVTDLQNTYTELSAELAVTQTAASELAEKEQRLAEIKAELAAASDGVITATGDETEAFENQLEVLEAINKAKQAELRQRAYDSITKQSEEYRKAMYAEKHGMESLNLALEKQAQYQSYIALGADGAMGKVSELWDQIQGVTDQNGYIDWFNPETQGYVKEVQDLLYILTGEKFNFKNESQLYNAVNGAVPSAENMEAAWLEANNQVLHFSESVEAADATQKAYLDNLVAGVRDGGMELSHLEALLNEEFLGLEGGAQIVADAMAYVQAALAESAENASGMEDGMSDAAASAAELEAAINPILSQMKALGEAYDEAYNSAYDSMDGQFKLFEKAPKVTAASIDDMMKALQSQSEYMQAYTANLQMISDKGINADLLAQLSDGSAESAAYVAALANDVTNNGSKNLDALNAAYEAAEQEKANFAKTVAEMQTDFSTKMAELQANLTTTVTEMDKSAEAAAAGAATVQAFADAASGKTEAVKNAFAAVAAAAAAALNVNVTVPGHAAGTDNAERGWAMVGENGPELMWFNGGEKVLNNAETEAIMSRRSEPLTAISSPSSAGSSFTVEVHPVYHINSNTSPEDIRGVLYDQNANLRALIEDTIEEIEQDRERSRYS